MPGVLLMKEGNKMIIYQLLPRLFGNTISTNIPFGDSTKNGVGKFNDITHKALQEIKSLGASHIWYTGVIEHATMTDYSQYGISHDDVDVVKGRAGSPYAIKDYYDVDPDLAENVPQRMREFEELVKRTHDEQLKVILDFVPNHVARAYSSDAKPKGVRDLGEDDDSLTFKPSNNFYYLQNTVFHPPYSVKIPGVWRDRQFVEIPAKATGNDKFTDRPEVNDWYETVKLNYGVDILKGNLKHFDPIPDTWLKMRDILLFWANREVDGFRCDMAEMVPIEFWKWVIPQIKKAHEDILFIAEIYSPQRYPEFTATGFDFLYDKAGLYDTLRAIVTGAKSNSITSIINDEAGINSKLLRFMENHDEQRIASDFFAGNPWKALPAVAVSALVDKAAFLIYFGQEVGEPALGSEGFSGADGRTTIYDYWGVPEFQKWVNEKNYDGGKLSDDQKKLRSFYAQLLNFAKSRRAIAQGDFIPVEEGAGIYGFLRVTGDDKVLVLVNFSNQEVKRKIQLSEKVCHQALIFDFQKITGENIFTNSSINFDSKREVEILFTPFFVGTYVLTIS